MAILQSFRNWFSHFSSFEHSGVSSKKLYNQAFFETHVTEACRYRQAHVDSLSSSEPLATLMASSDQIAAPVNAEESSGIFNGLDHVSSFTDNGVTQKQTSLTNEAASTPALSIRSIGSSVVSLLLDQAKGYGRQGTWDKAIATCNKVLALDPQQGEAYRLMGQAHQSMDNPYDAMGYYANALVAQPQSVQLHTNLGRLYHDLQNWEQAIHYYQQAIDLTSSTSSIEDVAASRAAQAGLIEAQIQYKRQASKVDHQVDAIYHSLSLSPETFTADEHCEMGHLLLQQGDEDNALECFQRAVDCQANCSEAHVQLAKLLEQRQQWQEAMFHYKQAATVADASRVISQNQADDQYEFEDDVSEFQSFESEPVDENGLVDIPIAASSFKPDIDSPNSSTATLSDGVENLPTPLAASSDRPLHARQPGQIKIVPLNPGLTQHHNPVSLKVVKRSVSSESSSSNLAVLRPLGSTSLPNLTDNRDTSDPLAASIQAFVALARSYEEHGDIKKAITHYQNALSLDPKNSDIHRELNLVLAQQTAES